MSEEDFSSLSIEDKIAHKSWKARLEGYEELKKKFGSLDPETESYEFSKWTGSLAAFAKDANMAAQEAGLGCILAFAENSPDVRGVPEQVLPPIIDKGLGAMRAGTKTKSLEVILMLVEADIPDPVIDALMPGLSHKLAKVVTGVVNALKEIVKQFGCKTVDPKPLLKQLAKMFGHSDKNVRAEATQLTVELYKWLGKAVEPSLKDLKPVQLKDLQAEFDKLPSERPSASRLLRSQQAIAAAAPPPMDEYETNEDNEYNELEEEPVEVDPYDYAEPVDIMQKLPKDFYNLIASSKWKERVEALEPLKAGLDTPKLKDNGNCGELISTLAGKISDANINVGALCITCIGLIATGLRKDFSQHKSTVVPPLIEKLKEKKITVLEPLRKTLDAVSKSVTISDLIEDISTGSGHKNPNVKAETLKWATRILSSITSQPPSTPEIKSLCAPLFKGLDDADTGVRESAAEAIGTLIKLVGDKFIKPFLEKTDAKKTAKIDEYKEKATISLKASAPVSKPPPPTSTPSAAPKIKKPPVLSSTKKPTLSSGSTKPAAEAPKPPAAAKAPPKLSSSKPPIKKPTSSAPAGSKPTASKATKEFKISFKYNQDDIDGLIEDQIPSNLITDLSNSAWKTRLAAIESIHDHINGQNPDDVQAELVVRQMIKKPGPKESNFQVTSKVYSIFALLAERIPSFSAGAASLAIPILADKLGDIKLKGPAGEALVAFAEATSLQFVFSQVYAPIKAQKAPKIQADALSWMKNTLVEFGISGLSTPLLVDFIKTLLGSSNVTVRSNATQLLAELRVYIGPALRKSVEDLNPNLLSNIDKEFEKVSSRTPEAPTRGAPPPAPSGAGDDSGAPERDVLDDLFPRVDISTQINGKLAEQLNNANWKIRKEGLDAVTSILGSANNRIKPNLGELPTLLKARLADANKNLVINALDIIGETAKAMGKPFDKYCKTLVGPVAGCLSDQKIQVRTAAFNSLTSIREASDLEPMLPGVGAALVPENSVQRKDLSKWLADNLELAKDKLPDLSPLVSPLISCLQDKNSDVRKQAQSCLKFVVQSVGFAPIKEKASSLKGASLQSVMPLIDSLRSEGPSPSVGGKPASSTLRPPSALSSRQLSSGPSSRPDSAADTNAKKKAPLLGKRPPTATSSSLSRSNSNAPPPAPAFPILQTDSRSKDQRLAREKPARWIFDSVPSDVIASVQEQSTNSFSSELRKSMFSTDHYKDKEYMNAVNSLYDIITCPEYDSLDKYQIEHNDLVDRVLFTSDLIIKYLTIRIHDSATTLCFRCLETMESLLQLLSSTGYSLPDNEAAIFFPAIISKMGDSKEAMKAKVSATLKQIYSLYPLNKSFAQIMDIGLKSKNAKVRAECLDELAKLIKQNDVSVCNPSKSMPIIAKHIADRDAGVRTGAINVIAEVYILTGDAVYKYLGRIGEKERSYLDERFKRITPNVTPIVEPSKLPENTGTHIFSFQRKDSIQQDHVSPPLPNATPTSISPIQSPQRSDYPEYSPIMAHTTIPPQPSPRNRTSFVPPLVSPGIPKSIPPTDHSNNSISLEMSRLDLPQVPNNGQSNIPALSPYNNNYSKQQDRYGLIPTNSVMERLGDQISDPDISLSLEGLREFESQISGGYEVISPYLNNIVIAISKKVRSLNTSPIPEDSPHFARLIKYLVNSLVQIFSTSELARNIDEAALHDLINQILIMLEISKTSSSETFVGFSRALNILMVRILDHCCPNSAFRCMFTLLQQLYDPNHIMEVELSDHSMLSLSEMICKCIAKLNRSIGPKLASQELDPQVLLYDINTLLIGVPRDYLINPNGYPEFKEVYRMVKTVIYDLLQVLKNDFFTKFGVIEDHNQHNLVLVLSNRLIETRRRSIKRKSMINAQT